MYYRALTDAQHGRHEGREDAVPFIKYMLGVILSAYRAFEDRFTIVEEKRPALEIVRKAAQSRLGRFTKQEIRELFPYLNVSTIEGLCGKWWRPERFAVRERERAPAICI